ncbi:PhoD-like phosphatase-domain-containing protein [Mucidula mucida]|nr:PhoD-like phosphatase-domain-containing protein [Mucidula mucida]
MDLLSVVPRHLAYNTTVIQKRHLEHVRRQLGDAQAFEDNHYPTFYGGDFSNTPYIWNGGFNFTHSVASGDPLDTSVLLWTRAEPLTSDGAFPDQSAPICLSYKISASSDLSEVVDVGNAFTSYDVDWTVKVEATGLAADTRYFFQFSDCTDPTTVSTIGKTRTLPHPDASPHDINGGNPLTLAVFSCSQYQAGWFNAYGYAAQKTETDFFIHLGDYIYESIGNGASIGRQTLGRELATIHDYRQRMNQYRTDTSLRTAHESAPWIVVWVRCYNTSTSKYTKIPWNRRRTITRSPTTPGSSRAQTYSCTAIFIISLRKAGTADSNDTTLGCSFSESGACFTDRKLAAIRAYHEWMPIRRVAPDDQLRIWRNFRIGKLMDLTMLDTRQYDRDLTDVYYNTECKHSSSLPTVDLDAWDGYRANRRRVLDYLYDNDISNTVILAGDSHANWVSDLAYPNDTTTYDPTSGEGAIGVEFAGTAVTSTSSFGQGISPAKADLISQVLVAENADLQWSEGSYRGFFTLRVSAENCLPPIMQ